MHKLCTQQSSSFKLLPHWADTCPTIHSAKDKEKRAQSSLQHTATVQNFPKRPPPPPPHVSKVAAVVVPPPKTVSELV